MMGKSAISYIFKRKEQAVTLATKSSIRVEGERVQVDPQLLFQRLVIACMNSDGLGEIFKHEICSYPAAPFDTPFTLRAPQKATLADTVWAQLSADAKSGPTVRPVRPRWRCSPSPGFMATASNIPGNVPPALPVRSVKVR